MPLKINCDHLCHCGTENKQPHKIGEGTCVRTMVESPIPAGTHPVLECPMWLVSGHEITDYSLRHQRGYSQHPCGCWSRSPGSENSIEMDD